MIKLIKEKRKTPVLKPPAFDCLKGTPAINVTRGCLHSCVYCYARGFTDAPPRGEVHLYENLPEMLERELDRKRRLPSWISFSTASDAFQEMDEILKTTYAVMKLLLERDIGISFLTKGFIPNEFIELFKRYPSRSPLIKGGSKRGIKARIGMVSLAEDYRKLFEPFSAHPLKRLLNIRNLIDAGIDVSVRIDPVIPPFPTLKSPSNPPLINNPPSPPFSKGGLEGLSLSQRGVWGDSGGFSEESMEHLIKRLKAAGVENISISSLVMRPSIMNQFLSELPFGLAKEILKHYNGQPYQRVITSAKTRLLPKAMRIIQYRSIKNIASRYGIKCYTCGCKNPDIPWEFCNPWISEKKALNINNRQFSLFT